MCRSVFLSGIVSAFLSALTLAHGGTIEDLEARWRSDYPGAAAQLERTAENFLAKGSFTIRSTNGTTVVTNDLTVASSGDKKVIVRDRSTIESPTVAKRPAESTVRCLRSDCTFGLRKNSPEEPYVLVKYADKSAVSGEFDVFYNEFARNATVYRGQSLLSRIQSDSFVVKGTRSLREGGREVVRIDYDYRDESVEESGAVYLEPRLNWAIRKVDISYKKQGATAPVDLKCEVDYDRVGEGAFFPTRAEYYVRFPRPDLYIHGKLELNHVTFNNIPFEAFKLTGYGLPDIPLKAVAPSPTFSYRNPLFWGSLLVAVLSFTVLRVTRVTTDRASASVAA